MKKLNHFNYFDAEGFFEKKELMVIGQKKWLDYSTKEILGTALELVIISDKTDYGQTDGEIINNLFEKFMVKIPKSVSIPMNSKVRLIEAEGRIFGDFREKLSVTAENVEVIGK